MQSINNSSFEEIEPSPSSVRASLRHNNNIPRPREFEVRGFPQSNPIADIFNTTARATLIVFILVIGGGIVLSLYLVMKIITAESNPNLGPALSVFLSFLWASLPFLAITLFLFAVAEIIQILHDIRAKLYKDYAKQSDRKHKEQI